MRELTDSDRAYFRMRCEQIAHLELRQNFIEQVRDAFERADHTLWTMSEIHRVMNDLRDELAKDFDRSAGTFFDNN